MPIKFECQNCGKNLQVKLQASGHTVKCPGCQTPCEVPKVHTRSAAASSASQTPPKKPRRNPAPFIFGGILLVVLIGFLVYVAGGRSRTFKEITSVLRQQVEHEANSGNVLGAEYRVGAISVLKMEEAISRAGSGQRAEKIDELRNAGRRFSLSGYDETLREDLSLRRDLYTRLTNIRKKCGYISLFE